LKQRYVLSPLLFNFASEYAIRKVQENQVSLELNRTYQLLVYANINLLGNNIYTINENTETLLGASRDVVLEINAAHDYVLSSELRAEPEYKDS
jgi:hypothetical protein